MKYDLFPAIASQEGCQELAQQYNKLDCLDEPSLKCFREAYVIAKMSGSQPVLITGDNGCGKTGYAQLMWGVNSIRTKRGHSKEMLNVNCSAFSENLIASELFGHKRGAFTGADSNREGKIQTAGKKGCLFLDEIGDLPLSAQALLLRFFQDNEIQPLGTDEPIKLQDPPKVICATNKDLRKEINEGRFREDLFNRINKFHVHVPPLRIRPKDCLQNANNFLDKFKEMQADSSEVVAEQLGKMKIDSNFYNDNAKSGYSWPGNFRELENRIYRAAVTKITCGGTCIKFSDLFDEGFIDSPDRVNTETQDFDLPKGPVLRPFDLEAKLDEIRANFIDKAIAQCNGEKTKAAKLLGYSNYQKMDRRRSKA